MTSRAITPANPTQDILVTADYAADVLDQSITVGAPGVTVTLPQNPQVGVTSIAFTAQQSFLLTAGLLGGLSGDPVSVPQGANFVVTRVSGGWLSSLSAGGSQPLAREWNQAEGLIEAQDTPTIIVSKEVTPLSTGRIRVVVSGSAVGAGDGGPERFQLSLSTGGSPTPPIFTPDSFFTSTDDNNYVGISLSVDLDLAGVPLFPVGVPVTMNAVLSASGSNIPSRADLQITLQEVPNPS